MSAAAWAQAGAAFGGLVQNRRAQNQSKKQWESEFYRGIQTRVQDAKAAGIHPLYAIGANTYSSSPQMVGGLNNPAAGIANAFSRANAEKRENKESEARVKKDEALASYYNSLAARTTQRNNTKQDQSVLPLSSNKEGKVLYTPGGLPYQVGAGSSAQETEDEYGQIPELFDQSYRYLRDRDFFGVKGAGKVYFKLLKRLDKEKDKSLKRLKRDWKFMIRKRERRY
jgi:hypothetical protein